MRFILYNLVIVFEKLLLYLNKNIFKVYFNIYLYKHSFFKFNLTNI